MMTVGLGSKGVEEAPGAVALMLKSLDKDLQVNTVTKYVLLKMMVRHYGMQ